MKKFVACLMACLMAVSVIGVQPEPVRADLPPETNVLELTTTASSLNLNVEVTLTLNLKGSVSAYELRGYLKFDPEVFYDPNLRDFPKDVYGYYESGSRECVFYKFNSNTGTSAGSSTLPSGKLCTISLQVKKAVNETEIGFEFARFVDSSGNVIRYANDTTRKLTNTKGKEIELAPATITGSSTVTVPVRFLKNPGFRSLTLKATYDSTRLAFAAVENADSKIRIGSTSAGTGVVTVDVLSGDGQTSEDYKGTAVVVNLIFRVVKPTNTGSNSSNSNGIQNPRYTNIDLSLENVRDKFDDTSDVTTESSFKTTGARVNVILSDAQLIGDVNGNNKIDLVDALYVIQYYNKERTLTSVEYAAADVNRDGQVNLVDALRILEYYNGKITYL